jgi:hypothetical protein
VENLGSTLEGRSLLSQIEKLGNRLNQSVRKWLARLLIETILEEHPTVSLRAANFRQVVNQIKEKFPEEQEEIWYVPSEYSNKDNERRNPSGKLYEAYVTKKRKLRRQNTIPTNIRRKSSVEVEGPDSVELDTAADTSFSEGELKSQK